MFFVYMWAEQIEWWSERRDGHRETDRQTVEQLITQYIFLKCKFLIVIVMKSPPFWTSTALTASTAALFYRSRSIAALFLKKCLFRSKNCAWRWYQKKVPKVKKCVINFDCFQTSKYPYVLIFVKGPFVKVKSLRAGWGNFQSIASQGNCRCLCFGRNKANFGE